jgi:hypothetical protein
MVYAASGQDAAGFLELARLGLGSRNLERAPAPIFDRATRVASS